MCKYIQYSKNEEYVTDFIVRNTYNSNAIEGNSMTQIETYFALCEPNHKLDKTAREIYEAGNHKIAWEFVLEKLQNGDFELTHDTVISLNKIINTNIQHIEGYRMWTVGIAGSKKTFPTPLELDDLMEYYIKYYNDLIKSPTLTYEEVAQAHIDFSNIHPFPDGNGRTNRLLSNILLLTHDYPPMTILYEDRKSYFEMMENNDSIALGNLIEEATHKELQHIMIWEDKYIKLKELEDDYDM